MEVNAIPNQPRRVRSAWCLVRVDGDAKTLYDDRGNGANEGHGLLAYEHSGTLVAALRAGHRVTGSRHWLRAAPLRPRRLAA